MRKKRVCLIALNQHGYYSLAIHYLRLFCLKDAYLAKRCSLFHVEYELEVSNKDILTNIVKLTPEIVAFSCYVWNIEKVVFLSQKIKEILPETMIMYGGQEVSCATAEELSIYSYADIIVDGAGEIPFRKILLSLVEDNLESIDQIPGVFFRRDEDLLRSSAPPETEIDLDSLPSPYLENAVRMPVESKLGIMIEQFRGCPNSCSFCFEADRTITPRSFSIDRIKEEFRWAKRAGQTYLHILDPVFCNNSLKKMYAFKEALLSIFATDEFRASIEIYADNITSDRAKLLDCYDIFDIGLQTTNVEANKTINRSFKLDNFLRGFNLLKSLGKTCNVYLIYGLPGDTYDSFMQSVSFAESLKPNTLFLNRLCVLKGTPLRKNREC